MRVRVSFVRDRSRWSVMKIGSCVESESAILGLYTPESIATRQLSGSYRGTTKSAFISAFTSLTYLSPSLSLDINPYYSFTSPSIEEDPLQGSPLFFFFFFWLLCTLLSPQSLSSYLYSILSIYIFLIAPSIYFYCYLYVFIYFIFLFVLTTTNCFIPSSLRGDLVSLLSFIPKSFC